MCACVSLFAAQLLIFLMKRSKNGFDTFSVEKSTEFKSKMKGIEDAKEQREGEK